MNIQVQYNRNSSNKGCGIHNSMRKTVKMFFCRKKSDKWIYLLLNLLKNLKRAQRRNGNIILNDHILLCVM